MAATVNRQKGRPNKSKLPGEELEDKGRQQKVLHGRVGRVYGTLYRALKAPRVGAWGVRWISK